MNESSARSGGSAPALKEPSRVRPLQQRLTVAAPKAKELLWAVVLVALPVVSAGYFGRTQIEHEIRAQVGKALQSTLGAAVTGVELWLETCQNAHRAIVSDPRLSGIALCLERDPSALDCEEDLRNTLKPYLAPLGGCAHLASTARGRVWSVGCQPLTDTERNALLQSFADTASDNPAARFVSPFYLSDARVVSGFASRAPHDTHLFTSVSIEALSRSMIAARAGDSAETYAVDAQGRMITESRFAEQLRLAGLLRPTEDSTTLRVEVRDPGVDLTAGERTGTLRQNQPWTRMARSLLEGRSSQDVDGYRDYRGVWVVGAWQWVPTLGIGIATEMDRDEALHSIGVLNKRLLILIAVLGGLGAAVSVIALTAVALRRRAASALARIDAMGQYQIVRKLGEGGMGTVYLAQHAFLRRPTALKVLRADRSDPSALARFEREVQATSELHHPNTIVVYDYGRADDGSFFYAMEYLEGLDLDELVANHGPLPPARVVHFLIQACGSLAEAHSRGLVHRDIKPSNLFACNRPGVFDVLKVLDFGIVKEDQTGQRSITHASTIMGTPEFMSPEMFDRAREVGAPSDIYSLGATAYYLLTAHPVFDTTTLAEACSAHLMHEPVRPSIRLGHEIDPELEEVVLACLEKAPGSRPASAARLLELLLSLRNAKDWTQADAAAFWRSVDEEGESLPQAATVLAHTDGRGSGATS